MQGENSCIFSMVSYIRCFDIWRSHISWREERQSFPFTYHAGNVTCPSFVFTNLYPHLCNETSLSETQIHIELQTQPISPNHCKDKTGEVRYDVHWFSWRNNKRYVYNTTSNPLKIQSLRKSFHLPASCYGFGKYHSCSVHCLKNPFQVYSPGYFPNQDWCYSLGSQFFMDTQKINFYHFLLTGDKTLKEKLQHTQMQTCLYLCCLYCRTIPWSLLMLFDNEWLWMFTHTHTNPDFSCSALPSIYWL